MEILSSFLSREKELPMLLITSATGVPEWLSNLEAQKLAIGLCDFTCCQRNHIFGDKVVPCDRGIVRGIVETMVDVKATYLFKVNEWRLARMIRVGEVEWCLRGGMIDSSKKEEEARSAVVEPTSLRDFKTILKWDDERDGCSLLLYDRTDTPILVYVWMTRT